MTVEPGEAFGFLGSNGAGALLAVTGALLFDRATCAEGGIVITLIWLAIWFIANLSGGPEPLLFDPVNTWTATLILAFALDFARPDSFKPGRD
jgi:hypothetical protein